MFLNFFIFFFCSFSLQAGGIEAFSPEIMERMESNNTAIEKIAYLKRVICMSNNMVSQAKDGQDLTNHFFVCKQATEGLDNVISFVLASKPYSKGLAIQKLSDCAGQCMLCFSYSKEHRSSLVESAFERKSLFAEQLLRDLKKEDNSVD